MIVDELFANLKVLGGDIQSYAEAGDWREVEAAAGLLSTLGANLGQDELKRVGAACAGAAAAGNAEQTEHALHALEAYASELNVDDTHD